MVIRFASLIFIMLLPFPIYLQNREKKAMFNLNTGKLDTVILMLLGTLRWDDGDGNGNVRKAIG